MRPRLALILVVLATLVLPWAGWQLVKQMESLLREGQEHAQIAAAQALASAVAATLPELPPPGTALFVNAARAPIVIDGSGDDWGELPGTKDRDGKVAFSLAQDENSLYALLEVTDATRQRADAGNALGLRGDRVELVLRDAYGLRRWEVGNAAPGSLQVAGGAPGLVGEWQETGTGYRIELQLPRPALDAAIGLRVFDVADAAQAPREIAFTGDEPAPLIGWSEQADAVLERVVPEGGRLRLVSPEGWVLASADQLATPAAPGSGAPPPPSRAQALLYRMLLAPRPEARAAFAAPRVRLDAPIVWQALSGVPASGTRAADDGYSVILAAAVPLRHEGEVRGALLFEQPGAALLLLANRAVFGVLSASLLAVVLGVMVVLMYAGVLSWRLRRLRNATERALRPDGRIEPNLPQLAARDDIGDLARSFARLLGEIGAYTDYLRTLGSKLSHELNTPLAIVRSSLDNLDHEALTPEARVYAERARAGADRLNGILRSMSEASRVERAIAGAEGEDFDLAELVRASGEAYRDLVAPRRLELEVSAVPLRLHGAPDLIAQALDKLIDNARSFTPEDGWIRIALRVGLEGIELAVANSGPPLPATMQDRLFDSLVSVRDTGRAPGVAAHLGLGLFIVRLVAELHGGTASAVNLPERGGVEFRVTLRGMPRARL